MGKIKDRFKKIRWQIINVYNKKRNTKGIFHAKMGTIKDRNGMDLTEADDIEMARIHRRTIQKRSSRPR